MVFIYVLIDPRDNEIRYVGKTVQALTDRLQAHIQRCFARTDHRSRWVAQLVRRGYRPRIELIQVTDSDHWREAEPYWIGYYRSLGCDLTNGTEGGDGGDTPTAEVRARISQKLTGVKMRPDLVAKMSAARMGHSVSDETRVKIRMANQSDPEKMELAVSLYLDGKSVEEAALISGVSRSPIYRELKERSIKPRGKGSSPHSLETRQLMSLTRKGLGYRPSLVKAHCQRWNINRGLPCQCEQHADQDIVRSA